MSTATMARSSGDTRSEASEFADEAAPLPHGQAGGEGKPWLRAAGHVCALGVAAVFLVAGIGKIWEPRQFAMDVKNYKIVADAYANLVAIFLPWCEVGAALALIHPRYRRAGALLIGGMLVMFICAVGYSALYKGLHIDCGCFGKAGAAQAGWRTIGFDALLLVITIFSVSRRAMPRMGTRG